MPLLAPEAGRASGDQVPSLSSSPAWRGRPDGRPPRPTMRNLVPRSSEGNSTFGFAPSFRSAPRPTTPRRRPWPAEPAPRRRRTRQRAPNGRASNRPRTTSRRRAGPAPDEANRVLPALFWRFGEPSGSPASTWVPPPRTPHICSRAVRAFRPRRTGERLLPCGLPSSGKAPVRRAAVVKYIRIPSISGGAVAAAIGPVPAQTDLSGRNHDEQAPCSPADHRLVPISLPDVSRGRSQLRPSIPIRSWRWGANLRHPCLLAGPHYPFAPLTFSHLIPASIHSSSLIRLSHQSSLLPPRSNGNRPPAALKPSSQAAHAAAFGAPGPHHRPPC